MKGDEGGEQEDGREHCEKARQRLLAAEGLAELELYRDGEERTHQGERQGVEVVRGDVLHAHVVLVKEEHELVRQLAQESHRHLHQQVPAVGRVAHHAHEGRRQRDGGHFLDAQLLLGHAPQQQHVRKDAVRHQHGRRDGGRCERVGGEHAIDDELHPDAAEGT